MLPEFDLLLPRTLPEALDMLAEGAPLIAPVAGGTNVVVAMRAGSYRPKTLMDVSRLSELRGIRRENGHIVIGGGTTIAELLASPVVAEYARPLRDAAATLGSPLIRNRATVAGNLVDASPAADTAPALLALGAEVELVRREGTRHLPLETFILGPNETLIEPEELMTSIRWPIPPSDSVAGYHKIGLRKALACAVVTVAVMVECDKTGHCRQARIALGAVAPTPIRAYAAEAILRNQRLTPETIADAARLSAEATQPIDDVRASATYRQRIVAVLVRRLLSEASQKACG